MSQNLATGDFHENQFTEEKKYFIETILRTPVKPKYGYSSDCELEYPFNVQRTNKKIPNLSRGKTVNIEFFPSFLVENKPEKVNLPRN